MHTVQSVKLDEDICRRIEAATKQEADKRGENVSEASMVRLFIRRGLADWERKRK